MQATSAPDQTFFSKLLAGQVTVDQVDDAIETWHTGSDPRSLHDYLGMTWEEYGRFVRDHSVLEELAQQRRQAQGQPLSP